MRQVMSVSMYQIAWENKLSDNLKNNRKLKIAKKLRAMNIDNPPDVRFQRRKENIMKLNKNQLKEMIREYIKEVLFSDYKIEEDNYTKLKNLIPEEIKDWQGKYKDDFKFKDGMRIKDINPDCPHYKSEGVIKSIKGDKVTYEVTNNGRNWKIGDELTKTKDQLTALSDVYDDDDMEEVKDSNIHINKANK